MELPPAAGMMPGLALLQFFSFYLTKTVKNEESQFAYAYKFFGVDVPVGNEKQDFDIYKNVGNMEWDT
jgi:hypothetical protein